MDKFFRCRSRKEGMPCQKAPEWIETLKIQLLLYESRMLRELKTVMSVAALSGACFASGKQKRPPPTDRDLKPKSHEKNSL